MTPVEAVARAIWREDHPGLATVENSEFEPAPIYFSHAKAAIRALAENVTDEMVDKAELAAEVRDDGKRWLHAAVRAAILAAMEDEA